MTATGRTSFASVDVRAFERRLTPPASLPEAAKAAFVDIVTRCPGSQFEPADVPLLCRWAEATAMAEQAATELQARDMVTDDGKVSPWFAIYERATKLITGLALRLRLGPQSRAPRAPKVRTPPISAYERLGLLDDDDTGTDERS
jgi:phage terminase small subunit